MVATRHGGAARLATERGMALLVSLLAAFVLAAVAGALVQLSSIETAIGRHHRRAVEGLYAAEAMLEVTLAELGAVEEWSDALAGTTPPPWGRGLEVPAGVAVDLRQQTVQLQRYGAGDASGERDWRLYASTEISEILPVPVRYGPWVVAAWIADDAADPDADPATDTNETLVVYAAAFGSVGASRALLATVAREATVDPAPPVLVGWRLVR